MKEIGLTSGQVCRAFEFSKSSLFRWESDGLIPKVPRVKRGYRGKQRLYGPEHLRALSKLTGIEIPEKPVIIHLTLLVDADRVAEVTAALEGSNARILEEKG